MEWVELDHYTCSALGSIANGSRRFSLAITMARVTPSVIRISIVDPLAHAHLASKFQTFRRKNEERSGQLSYVIDFGSAIRPFMIAKVI